MRPPADPSVIKSKLNPSSSPPSLATAVLSRSLSSSSISSQSQQGQHEQRQRQHPTINTSNTAVAATQESIQNHAYWSGFYKKTIKERRTQLGLAFPHLTRPTSLDSFASTQTSAKTSGQSTPNLGPTRSTLAMSSIHNNIQNMFSPASAPTTGSTLGNGANGASGGASGSNGGQAVAAALGSSFQLPLSMPVPRYPTPPSSSRPASASGARTDEERDLERGGGSIPGSTISLARNKTAIALHLANTKGVAAVNSTSPLPESQTFDREALERDLAGRGSNMEEDQQPSPMGHFNSTSMSSSMSAFDDSDRAPLSPIPDDGDIVMTEEERRDQLERERKATAISNLEEQRKMIGTPNGHLLEGDLSLDARLDAILATSDQSNGVPFPVHGLDEQIANNMIENCIGTMGMPVGLAFNFTINENAFVIPMAIEEPSVIAAVSSAAKTISTYQGFQAWAPERNMIVAQVQLLDIRDEHMDEVMIKMKENEEEIKNEANEYCTNMVLRGGGVQRVTLHRIRRHRNKESFQGQDLLVKYGVVSAQALPSRGGKSSESSSSSGKGKCSEWLVVHLHVDVGDAMGANCANTVAEGIAPFLAKMSGGRIGVRILSNLNVDRIAKSTFRLPFSHMGYKSLPGKDVAVRILEAFEWAELDPYRAATHNKGIMNGIDAVALATGQDWRAIEAGAHAWASGAGTYSERSSENSASSPTVSSPQYVNGNGPSVSRKRSAAMTRQEEHFGTEICRGDAYKPLTRYWVEEDEDRLRQGFKGQDALVFCGELEMPIMVGTKGGVLSTNPIHAFTLGVMRYPDSKQLAMAMVTVGLAQNFAAMRALVTEGIQRGHMALHARNIAISAGTPPASVDEVTAHMIDTGRIRIGAARSYIEQRGLGFYSAGASSNSSNAKF
ncbi:hypothetical protein BGZ83_007172 [Gryganskiella cystojenkinii]|nr:hypothetical protein BGZ83_007172 [Gryganskiella cystojenkinii]